MFEGGTTYLPLRNVNLGQGGNGEMITTPTTWFAAHASARERRLRRRQRGRGCRRREGALGRDHRDVHADDVARAGGRAGAGATRDRSRERALDRAEPPPPRPHGRTRGDRSVPQRAGARDAHGVRVGPHAPSRSTGSPTCAADYVKPGIDWVLLEESDDGWDLFGDGTVRCWRTPGHSPGHQSFEVTLAERRHVPPGLRRREHDRPPQREGAAGLPHRRDGSRALGAQAAAPRVALARPRSSRATTRTSGPRSSRHRTTTSEREEPIDVEEPVPRVQQAAGERDERGVRPLVPRPRAREHRDEGLSLRRALCAQGRARPAGADFQHLAVYEYTGDYEAMRKISNSASRQGRSCCPSGSRRSSSAAGSAGRSTSAPRPG